MHYKDEEDNSKYIREKRLRRERTRIGINRIAKEKGIGEVILLYAEGNLFNKFE